MGVLEDHLHSSAVGLECALTQDTDICQFTTEPYFTCRGIDQTNHAATDGCFSASALTHKPEGFSPTQVEAHAIDCADVADRLAEHSLLDREVFLEVSYLKDRFGGHDRSKKKGLRKTRKPWLYRLLHPRSATLTWVASQLSGANGAHPMRSRVEPLSCQLTGQGVCDAEGDAVSAVFEER